MKNRNDIIDEIDRLLGPEGSRDLATKLYDVLRADCRVYYSHPDGLALRDGVDLWDVAWDELGVEPQ